MQPRDFALPTLHSKEMAAGGAHAGGNGGDKIRVAEELAESVAAAPAPVVLGTRDVYLPTRLGNVLVSTEPFSSFTRLLDGAGADSMRDANGLRFSIQALLDCARQREAQQAAHVSTGSRLAPSFAEKTDATVMRYMTSESLSSCPSRDTG